MATPTEEGLEGGVEAAEHAPTGLPQLDFDTYPSQIFWLVVALIGLYWLMNTIALPRISSVLEERADAITDDIDQAEEYRRKAEVAEEQYQQALRDARARAQEIAAETRAVIQKEVDAATQRADAEIAARTVESEKRIREIRDSAMASVEQVAKETAQAIVEAVMPDVADDAAIAEAVDARL